MGEEELSLTGEQVDLSQHVTDEGGIWSLRQVEKVRGWNSIEYGAGLSGKNTPATALSMNRAYIPPGPGAPYHQHPAAELHVNAGAGAHLHLGGTVAHRQR